jgi:hypothetical protein
MNPSEILLIGLNILGVVIILLMYGVLMGLLIIGIGATFIYGFPKLCDYIDKTFG